jgi:hypothetical protein
MYARCRQLEDASALEEEASRFLASEMIEMRAVDEAGRAGRKGELVGVATSDRTTASRINDACPLGAKEAHPLEKNSARLRQALDRDGG